MRCPACNYTDTKVLDSRLAEHDNTVRRRRVCEHCQFRFSTREETEILNLTVIKRDGRREAYVREKIEAGLARALEKRPISTQEFRALLSAIERDIYIRKKDEIKTSDIGEIVMRHLQKLDQVAYIRFASVYRSFTDVAHFRAEIRKLAKPPHQSPPARVRKKVKVNKKTHVRRRNK